MKTAKFWYEKYCFLDRQANYLEPLFELVDPEDDDFPFEDDLKKYNAINEAMTIVAEKAMDAEQIEMAAGGEGIILWHWKATL